jgi:hypothetical protein
MLEMLRTPRERDRRWFEVIDDPADDRGNLGDHATEDRAGSRALSPHIGRRPVPVRGCLSQQRLSMEIGGRMDGGGVRVHRVLLHIDICWSGSTLVPAEIAHHAHPTHSPTVFARWPIAWVNTEA